MVPSTDLVRHHWCFGKETKWVLNTLSVDVGSGLERSNIYSSLYHTEVLSKYESHLWLVAGAAGAQLFMHADCQVNVITLYTNHLSFWLNVVDQANLKLVSSDNPFIEGRLLHHLSLSLSSDQLCQSKEQLTRCTIIQYTRFMLCRGPTVTILIHLCHIYIYQFKCHCLLKSALFCSLHRHI